MRARIAVLVGLIVSSGCGGTSITDPATGGSAGSAGVGGMGGSTGGSSGSGGSTGGSTGACAPGAPCANEGSSCTPPGCCVCTYACQGGKWTTAACPACLAPSCPAVPPQAGTICDPCANPVNEPCQYDQCPDASVVATCDGSTWKLETQPCPPLSPCGPDPSAPCPPGMLCVHPGGIGDGPYCKPNPCGASAPVSCTCAEQLCSYGYCSGATPTDVYCDCPNC